MDEDRFAGLQLGVVEQHVLHRAEGDRRAGGVLERNAVRRRNDEPGRHVETLAREAVDVEAHHAADGFAQVVAALAAGAAMAAGLARRTSRPYGRR